jgi:hypothetical protein
MNRSGRPTDRPFSVPAGDDPTAGWKGRGLWASTSPRAPFHMEGGKGMTSKAIHFALRPDPLAK